MGRGRQEGRLSCSGDVVENVGEVLGLDDGDGEELVEGGDEEIQEANTLPTPYMPTQGRSRINTCSVQIVVRALCKLTRN